jgi:hypothetical protein
MPQPQLTPGFRALHVTNVPQVGAGGPFEQSATATAGFASGTITIGGTPTTGDTVGATINGHAVTISPTTGQTIAQVATNLKNAINADGTDSLIVLAGTPVGAVIPITALLPGSPGMYSLVGTATGGHTTSTASGSELDLANGVVIPNSSFGFLVNGEPQPFFQDQPTVVDATTKTALRSAGLIY